MNKSTFARILVCLCVFEAAAVIAALAWSLAFFATHGPRPGRLLASAAVLGLVTFLGAGWASDTIQEDEVRRLDRPR